MQCTLNEISKAYYSSVRAIAEEIATEFGLTEPGQVHDNESIDECLTQMVDGSEWVTYTFKAKLVALLSDNNEAHFGCYSESDKVAPEAIAYFAMQADVLELLNNEWFFKDLNKAA